MNSDRPATCRGETIVTLRQTLRSTDADAIRAIVSATKMFTPAEIDVALELVRDNLARGRESGYLFIIADRGDRVIGYTAYGAIPCTLASYDLYWIAVHPNCQGAGVGKRLLVAAEEHIRSLGGQRVYVETSGREAYRNTRRFYEQAGYRRDAVLHDFYAPGDDKVVYLKCL